jgi:tetratricopeptide (TPR) repeat protein
MPRNLAALALLAAFVAIASGAQAASQKLWDACGGRDDNAAIKACTQILAGKESRESQAIASYNRGSAQYRKGDYARAIADLTSAIELDPKLAEAFNTRAWAYYYKWEPDYGSAIADATRAIELDPKLAERDPKLADGFASRALGAYNRTEYDSATVEATRAIQLDPKNVLAFLSRGRAYSAKGDYERAIADLTRGIDLNSTFANSYWYRGVAYLKSGRLDLARADLTKALKLSPDYEEAKIALAELEKAEVSAKAGVTTPPSPAQQAALEPSTPAIEAPPVAPPAASPAALPLGKRVALVIGNAAYTHTQALANPKNDAADMAAVLTRLGFTVIFEQDLNKQGMDDTFRRFAREVKSADAALFYYAGHAMQFEGVNYLMPVDAKLADEADVPYEMAKLDDVVADMARMSGVRIAVLDACRNNPLEEQLKRSVASTRGIAPTRGLARIARPEGLIVAYATQSGNVAADGTGRNSPFTGALLKNIETPGLEVGTLFRRVMGAVKQETGGKQHPELSVLFDGEFYFKPGS